MSVIATVGLTIALWISIATSIAYRIPGNIVIKIGVWLIFILPVIFAFKKIDIGWHGVLVIFGQRVKLVVREGFHGTFLPWIITYSPVDMREQVEEIPSPSEGKPGFIVATGVNIPARDSGPAIVDQRVELLVRVVFRYRVADGKEFDFLSFDRTAIVKALRNKSVDLVRARGARMSDADFIAELVSISPEIKREIDAVYPVVTVEGLDIPKAEPADADMKKAKQDREKQRVTTQAQHEDTLGQHGTVSRIEETARRLRASGLSQEEATTRAIEIVQTQEGRMAVKATRVDGSAGSLEKLVGLLKGDNS